MSNLFLELGATDIKNLVEYAQAHEIQIETLPKSSAGVPYRAENEGWKSRKIPGKGGPTGFKTIYTLPEFVLEELERKNLLSKAIELSENIQKPSSPALQESRALYYSKTKNNMSETATEYESWAASLDKSQIVPVPYYANVFASAGPGFLTHSTETEAMWFRKSFFDYLQAPPSQCFCTRISGDSMFPTLIDRGTVLWQATNRYVTEGIYLFRQHEELRIKRLRRMSANIFNVISDNENKSIYPTEELDLSRLESHEFEIYGKYLWDCGIAK